jgi:transcription elongation GreA/GreB family factor
MRGRFSELIARQLDLFEEQDAEFLRRVDDAERAYDAADREEAEEVYGRYQELIEHGTEALAEMRDAYAATIDPEEAEEYVAEFNQTVMDRLPRFGLEIEDV